MSFGQNFRKRQYGLNHIVFWSKLSKKTIWFEPYCLLVKTFEKDNMGWTISSFGENFLKRQYGLNHIVFLPKFSKKIKLVEPYCLLIKSFLKDYFLPYSDFNSRVTNNFLRQYGSCADKTVQVVQMDNTVQQDNTGWNRSIFIKSTNGSNNVVFSKMSSTFSSRDITAWPLLSLQGWYTNFHQ